MRYRRRRGPLSRLGLTRLTWLLLALVIALVLYVLFAGLGQAVRLP